MKKFFLYILFSFLGNSAYAWMQNPFTVSYDNDFNPIVSVELTNATGKNISNIDFVIFIERDGANQWDVTAVKELHINESVNMPPSNKRAFKLKPKVPNGWHVDKVGVEKIRFTDGSIKQY